MEKEEIKKILENKTKEELIGLIIQSGINIEKAKCKDCGKEVWQDKKYCSSCYLKRQLDEESRRKRNLMRHRFSRSL